MKITTYTIRAAAPRLVKDVIEVQVEVGAHAERI